MKQDSGSTDAGIAQESDAPVFGTLATRDAGVRLSARSVPTGVEFHVGVTLGGGAAGICLGLVEDEARELAGLLVRAADDSQ